MQVDKTVGYSSFLQHYSSYNIPLAGDGQQTSSTATPQEAQVQKAQESVVPAVQTPSVAEQSVPSARMLQLQMFRLHWAGRMPLFRDIQSAV